MRLLENAVRPRRTKPTDRRVRTLKLFEHFDSDQSCVLHHICDCKLARIQLLETTLRVVNAEFGGVKIVVNGVGHTTMREWLHLDEALKSGE